LYSVTIEQAMHLKTQDVGFFIERPRGTDCYIFLHFINPVDIFENGRLVRTSYNACYIYAPKTPQYYRAASSNLYHNYIHFQANDLTMFSSFNLPLNKIFYTNHQEEITECIEFIEMHRMLEMNNFENRKDDFQRLISEKTCDLFSLLNQEQMRERKVGTVDARILFKQLKTMVYSSPKDWDIDRMAKYVHLSRSRFFVKYREIFGTTPNEDLVRAALDYAEHLLTHTNMSVADVAFDCGFSSVEYFIRLFRKRKQITPGEFRKKYKQ